MEDILCPYCNNIMTRGFVNTPGETFYFYKEGVKLPLFRSRWSKVPGLTIIKNYKMLSSEAFKNNAYSQPALMCSNCKKVIIEIDPE